MDPRIRVAISPWSDDVPRGTVSSLRLQVRIARKTFSALRKPVRVEGPAAVLGPKSRRPHSSATCISENVDTRPGCAGHRGGLRIQPRTDQCVRAAARPAPRYRCHRAVVHRGASGLRHRTQTGTHTSGASATAEAPCLHVETKLHDVATAHVMTQSLPPDQLLPNASGYACIQAQGLALSPRDACDHSHPPDRSISSAY